tara:strand:+ start:2953 stop:4722 length:1770 start_codon:yes stop_codon:yes gene_type:complete
MKKFFLTLASVSSIALFTSSAVAEDRILSPVGGWSVEKLKAVNSLSACLIYSEYENSVILTLEALQSQLSALRLNLPSRAFETGKTYEAIINITPNYRAVKSAQAMSDTELVIDAGKDPDILWALQQGFILSISIDGKSYGLSLNGISEGVRRLLTCRDTNWRAARKVYSIKNDDSAPLSKQQVATDEPLQISAFPLNPELEPRNQASTSGAVSMEDTSDKSSIIAQSLPEPLLNSSGAMSVSDRDEPENEIVVATETREFVEQKGHVVDLANAGAAQPVVEPVTTVTRVHIPKVKIQPRHSAVMPDERELVDVIVSKTTGDDLVKPPAFDEPVVVQDNQMLTDDARLEKDIITHSDVPGGVNPSINNADTVRLARKNEHQEEILLEDTKVPERNEKAILSQAPNRVNTRPVIIPRVPEADLLSRFDITNTNVQAMSDNAESAETFSSEVRAVSNADLERQLKEASPKEQQPTQAGVLTPPAAHFERQEPEVKPSLSIDLARWHADKGDDLRETIANWSLKEGVELIWDSDQQFSLLDSVHMDSSYEKVIAHILNKYMITPDLPFRPVGQLYVDPQTGSKVLIIQTDQG